MGFLTIVKRTVVYGGITMALTSPFVYDLGYEKGKKDSSIVETYNKSIETLTEKGKEIKDKTYRTLDELFKK